MNPQTIQTLKSLPEFQEVLTFIASKLAELDSISSLQGLSVAERNDAVSGRIQAATVLSEILEPFIHAQTIAGGFNPREYAIDPDDVK